MKTRIMAVALGVLLFLSPLVSAFEHCPADLNGDGEVGPADLAMLLASWGPCPGVCGDGVLNPGEECDPPNGVNCDENCQFMPSDCCFPHGFPPGCEDPICEALVCDLDPFCCDIKWDPVCAFAAIELCPECFGTDCCFVHGTAGCTDPDCEEIICDIFPSCCVVAWDQDCVLFAGFFCDQCMP